MSGGFGALAAFLFRIRMLAQRCWLPPALGLTLACLPPMNQPQALGILAIPLVPTVRLKVPTAPLAQTNPRREAMPPGGTTRLWIRLRGTHGRCYSQRLNPRRRVAPPSRGSFYQNRIKTTIPQCRGVRRNKTRKENPVPSLLEGQRQGSRQILCQSGGTRRRMRPDWPSLRGRNWPCFQVRSQAPQGFRPRLLHHHEAGASGAVGA